MSAHAATPYVEVECPGASDQLRQDELDGALVCEFPYGLDETSAFVKRACNAHQFYQDALELIVAGIDDPQGIARAALRKAGEA